MLFLRKTTDGREYFEIDKKIPGAVPPTKNHQGGLQDDEDESDGKCFASPDSPRCPVATLKAYLSHLNPLNESLFQCPRPGSNKFNPANEKIWFSNSPVRRKFLVNMSVRAGIVRHLTNHCLRATLVTVFCLKQTIPLATLWVYLVTNRKRHWNRLISKPLLNRKKPSLMI